MKLISTLFALLITFSLSAQLKKGDLNIGVMTNAPMNLQWRSDGPDYRTYHFDLNPRIGYFLLNRLEIGGGPYLSFDGSKYNNPLSGFKNTSQSLGLNLYSRYYLKKEGKLVPYVTISGTYMRTTGTSQDYYNPKYTFKTNQWELGGGAGLSWFVSPKVALFGELTYSRKWEGYYNHSNNLNFKIGIQVFLGRKTNKSKKLHSIDSIDPE